MHEEQDRVIPVRAAKMDPLFDTADLDLFEFVDALGGSA